MRYLTFERGTVSDLDLGHLADAEFWDIDGDGEGELVAYGFGQDGGFQVAKVAHWGADGLPIFHPPIRTPVEAMTLGPQGRCRAVDWTGNGQMDILSLEPWWPGNHVMRYTFVASPGAFVFQHPTEVATLDLRIIEHFATSVEAVDWDGDGDLDMLVSNMTVDEYWPKVDFQEMLGADFEDIIRSRFDERGRWKGGRVRGFVYLLENTGTRESPAFAAPVLLHTADGSPMEVYGNFCVRAVDLDGDGDLDLLCGNWLTHVCYFENVGTRSRPSFVARGEAVRPDGSVHEFLQPYPAPYLVHWGGKPGIIAGSDGAYVQYAEVLGFSGEGKLILGEPKFLQQLDGPLTVGSFCVPSAVNWDGDGDLDILAGNEYGNICYFENVGSRTAPKFVKLAKVSAGGAEILHRSGPEGNAQGPTERMFGYTGPAVSDWDGDGLLDIIVCDSLGEYTFYRNVGTRVEPRLAKGEKLTLGGKPFRSVWRVRPAVLDSDGDGIAELITLDTKGYLAVYHRTSRENLLELNPAERLTDEAGNPIKLDGRINVGSVLAGRTQLSVADWDGDGRWDIVYGYMEGLNTADGIEGKRPDVRAATVRWLRNIGTNTRPIFRDAGLFKMKGWPIQLGMHTPSPFVVDWDGDGRLDLMVGCDNGRIYFFHRDELEWDRG